MLYIVRSLGMGFVRGFGYGGGVIAPFLISFS